MVWWIPFEKGRVFESGLIGSIGAGLCTSEPFETFAFAIAQAAGVPCGLSLCTLQHILAERADDGQ